MKKVPAQLLPLVARKRMRSHIVALVALAALPLKAEPCWRQVATMGTLFSVKVWAAANQDPCILAEKALVAVEESEKRLSTWRHDSELAACNRAPAGEEVPLSPSLCQELTQALRWAEATLGAFDPTVGPLVRAYDLRGVGRWPSQQQLEAARQAVGYKKLRLENCKLVQTASHLLLEEGGFGKGAALDAALEALEGQAQKAELNLGGQVSFWGQGTFAVDLSHPDRREEVVATWVVPPGSVATSGNSERSRMVAGKRLGHILDPRSGYPARDFGSVAVWAPNGLAADALSTALYVLGPEEGARLLERLPEVAAVFLVREGENLRLFPVSPTGKLIPKAPNLRVNYKPRSVKGQKEEP